MQTVLKSRTGLCMPQNVLDQRSNWYKIEHHKIKVEVEPPSVMAQQLDKVKV